MKNFLALFAALFFFIICNTYSNNHLQNRYSTPQEYLLSSSAQISPSIMKVLSGEFDGIMSDKFFLNVLTFMGEKIMKLLPTSQTEWQAIYHSFETVIELDPRGEDPFVLATTTLPWEAKMVEETNILLEKVAQYRVNDYRPYFFLWYNHYKLLHNPETAARYLKKAAKIPGAPKYLEALTTRMHLYSGNTSASIAYIYELLQNNTDKAMHDYLTLRLEALKRIDYLENAIVQYEKKYKKQVTTLQQLIDKQIINEIPSDPYGGEFYILKKSGHVYTTSKLVKVEKKKKRK